MSVFLALTPAELAKCRTVRTPRAHIAYAVGDGGRLLRSELPREVRGGLLGLSDRCSGPIGDSSTLCRTLLRECAARRFGGVLADFDGAVREDRLAFLSQLGAALVRSGLRLYVPERFAVPEGIVLICTALSGGTQHIALDCQRLAMDFTLPCRSGEGLPLTREELAGLRERCGSAVFFSDELCANYFSYTAQGAAHFVLFDTAETLRRKLQLGRERGIETAFFMYPEVDDLLPELFSASDAASSPRART